MIRRSIEQVVQRSFRSYPVVTITGPRQSGKTTLVKALFSDLPYINLEDLAIRQAAEEDPVGFMESHREGAVLDEIQRVPKLLSQIQVIADRSGSNSLFVLTGSQQLGLLEAIGQSLAGRTALFKLWPLSLAELSTAGISPSLEDILYTGFFPRIYDQSLDPAQALGNYVETYVERDIRRQTAVHDLSQFQTFVRLCAGRIGQLLNLSSLANDVGVSQPTAQKWVSLLETSFLVFRLPPFHANIRKRLVRSPKLYFNDVGLAAHLIGIDHPKQVQFHPLRGNLFENLVIGEVIKHFDNQARRPNIFFFRDHKGNELDLLISAGAKHVPIEIKSAQSLSARAGKNLEQAQSWLPPDLVHTTRLLVYAGSQAYDQKYYRVQPWTHLHEILGQIKS